MCPLLQIFWGGMGFKTKAAKEMKTKPFKCLSARKM